MHLSKHSIRDCLQLGYVGVFLTSVLQSVVRAKGGLTGSAWGDWANYTASPRTPLSARPDRSHRGVWMGLAPNLTLPSRSELDHKLSNLLTAVAKRLIQVCVPAVLFLIMSMNPVLNSCTQSVCNRFHLPSTSQIYMHLLLCLLTCVAHQLLSSDLCTTSLSHGLYHCFKRRNSALIRCRVVGGRRYRLSRFACRRQRLTCTGQTKSFLAAFFHCVKPVRIVFLHMCARMHHAYCWSPSRAMLNRIAHALTGNISMRELQDIMTRLGMTQQWHKQAAKTLLQDSARKQKAQELLQANLLFDLGRLIHDTPVPSSSPSPSVGGKGAGKGKGKAKFSTRTPWTDLVPRPDSIFVDASKNPVAVIPIKLAHSTAKGVFLAGVGDYESYLGITSNSPLAMLIPQTPKVRSTLQSRGVKSVERLVALRDPNSGVTTPKPTFLVSLGTPVEFAETTPDAQFEAPVPPVEVAVDIEISHIDPCMQQEVDKNPRYAFNQIVHAAFSEQIVSECYPVFVRNTVLQGIIKIPSSQLLNVLRRSGPDGVVAKEKWRAQPVQLPLALIHQSQLRDKNWESAVKVANELPGFAGIHRSATGSKSLRFDEKGIAKAREGLCVPGLYSEDNISIVARYFFQVQGVQNRELPSGSRDFPRMGIG